MIRPALYFLPEILSYLVLAIGQNSSPAESYLQLQRIQHIDKSEQVGGHRKMYFEVSDTDIRKAFLYPLYCHPYFVSTQKAWHQFGGLLNGCANLQMLCFFSMQRVACAKVLHELYISHGIILSSTHESKPYDTNAGLSPPYSMPWYPKKQFPTKGRQTSLFFHLTVYTNAFNKYVTKCTARCAHLS